MRWVLPCLAAAALLQGRGELPSLPRAAPPPAASAAGGSAATAPYLWWYPALQRATRPSGCVHRPSCSRYAAEVVHRHGPLLGAMLTLDRLYREPDDVVLSPREVSGGGARISDPPEHNTFWWPTHESSDPVYFAELLRLGWTGRAR